MTQGGRHSHRALSAWIRPWLHATAALSGDCNIYTPTRVEVNELSNPYEELPI
jgi:hypothetical protein